MNKKGFFITGTDTGVGKTLFSTLLIKRYNFDYWKPIQTGASNENDTLYIKNRTYKCYEISWELLFHPSYLTSNCASCLEDF